MSVIAGRELPIAIFTIGVFAAFSFLSPSFLTPAGIRLVFEQGAIVGIIAIAVTMTIIMGGIDLSVGSLMALLAAVAGMMLNAGLPAPVACLLTLCVGGLCGLVNGLLIARFNIPDIVATLGTMYFFRSAGILLSGGIWIKDFPPSFDFYGRGLVAGIPFPVLLWICLTALFVYVLNSTRFGRRIYAIGGNVTTAMRSGISVGGTKVRVYVISGMMAAVSGIVFASKVGSVQVSTVGVDLPFNVIAAILIGGASVFGGVGSVVGSALGALALSALQSGLIQVRVSPYWIDVSVGALIILAVILNTFQHLRNERKLKAVLQ
jgi:ribose/xylose/arabinose/galactoside ABC-type transport system permease subunit